eukprot:COSAG02_NODE_20086_length_849_cov_1.013333_2_plen_39_part_01
MTEHVYGRHTVDVAPHKNVSHRHLRETGLKGQWLLSRLH